MNSTKHTVIYFGYGRYSKNGDGFQWNPSVAHHYTLLMKGSFKEFTYSGLVDKICKKNKVDKATTKLKLTYFPLLKNFKKPRIIMDDEDVLIYLMEGDQHRNVLHVELIKKGVEQNQSCGKRLTEDRGSGIYVRNEEIVSDAVGGKRKGNTENRSVVHNNRGGLDVNGVAKRGEELVQPKMSECVAGLKFNDFEKLKKEVNFAVGQTWALYDKLDGMPRLYAKIKKVSDPSFGLRITYLEPDPDDDKEIQWVEEDLPVSVGKFRFGKNENTKDGSIFSHVIQCNEGSSTCHFTVCPRKGETWALFKNWDINWSSEPDSHRNFEYEYVEVLSDYADGASVSVAVLHKAKGFASVFFRMGNGDADIFHILPHSLYRFSHRVPSFKLTGIEGKGVPKDAYELDQAALPGTIEDVVVPSHLLAKPTCESNRKSKSQTIYLACNGKVFQTGQIWSFCDGREFPQYYGRIQKITCTQVLDQEAVYKLHVNRFKSTRDPEDDVIQYEDKNMPVGCGTFNARKVLEILAPNDLSHQIVPLTSADGNQYTILPKVGEVWVIYKSWSKYISKVCSCSYDVVQVLDDTLDYKVILLELEPDDDDDENILFQEVKECKNHEGEESEPIFTIPKSERLRFSHKLPASHVTKEIYGEIKDLIEVDSEALPDNVIYSESE